MRTDTTVNFHSPEMNVNQSKAANTFSLLSSELCVCVSVCNRVWDINDSEGFKNW